MNTQTSTWQILSQIDCNAKIEKKNGLTYLSWAWAWGIVKEKFPLANYEVIKFDGKPYLFDENLGYLIQTRVTIEGETIQMQLPVMDGANKAQKHIPYTYSTKYGGEKTVESATMFDINTAIMRCLTKNLAMFGLGHYIYAGEDLPQDYTNEKSEEKEKVTPNISKHTEPTNWLNVKDAKKEFTPEFLAVCEDIKNGLINSVSDVRKKYKVSKEVEKSINSALEKYLETAE